MAAERIGAAASHRSPDSSRLLLDGRLNEGIGRLDLEFGPDQRQALLDFLALLVKWNRVYNLTSVRDPVDMLAVHLLDALAVVPLLDEIGGGTLLDVGSGAGLPVIPLAIARPGFEVISVDAVGKKIGFQSQVKATLGLTNFTAIHRRVEALTLEESPAIIISRAYADLAAMLLSVGALAGPDTTVVAMKGVVPEDELAALPVGWGLVESRELDVPFLGAARCAVVLRHAR